MNIFVVDPDPLICAKALDDKRCVKMVLETAQLLSTALNLAGGSVEYKSTHVNHPCSIWTRSSRANYLWLLEHFDSLSSEYSLRFNKIHACMRLRDSFVVQQHLIVQGGLTPFVNCTIFKEVQDVHLAYRQALVDKWIKDTRSPKWTNSKPPSWFPSVKSLDAV